MKTTEIIEGNKLIAAFMGYNTDDERIVAFGTPYGEDLEYNSSWDWLMPVVERIECECFFSVIINEKSCQIIDTETKIGVRSISTKNKIDAVFSACVQFANWYVNELNGVSRNKN